MNPRAWIRAVEHRQHVDRLIERVNTEEQEQ